MESIDQLRGVIGIIVILVLCWLLSTDRRRINWRLVAWGLGLQFVFALIILKTHPGRAFFDWVTQAASDFSALATAGGLHGTIGKMGEILGPRQATYAADRLGTDGWSAGRSGTMRYAPSTGILTTGSAATGRLVNPNHRFHGDVGARP